MERLMEGDASGGGRKAAVCDRNHLTCSVTSELETEGVTGIPGQSLPGLRIRGRGHHHLYRHETFHPDLIHSQLPLPQLHK